jgi:hypothetical protein
MSNHPIRLTKQRLEALRDAVTRGLYEMEVELQDNYGIDIADAESGDFELLDSQDRPDVEERVEKYQRAQAAWLIISRRYGS